jgi:hypothetical protein
MADIAALLLFFKIAASTLILLTLYGGGSHLGARGTPGSFCSFFAGVDRLLAAYRNNCRSFSMP